jgi:hypothetical protein
VAELKVRIRHESGKYFRAYRGKEGPVFDATKKDAHLCLSEESANALVGGPGFTGCTVEIEEGGIAS